MSIAEKLQTIAENEQRVYDAGKKAGQDEFWDKFQDYGNRLYYTNAFSYWGATHISPKYVVSSSSINSLFQGSTKVETIDWEKFDFSKASSYYTTFNSCFSLKNIGAELLPTSLVANCWVYAFSGCQTLESIKKIKAFAGHTWTDTFKNCYALKDIEVEGEIGQNGFNVQWSPLLTHDSLMSIIGALKDYSSTGGTHTITFGQQNIAKLTEDELLLAEKKGWDVI